MSEPGTPRDGLLLRVVLGDGPRAGEAWHALRPTFDLQQLPPGWYPLMPLLYTRLRDVAPEAPLLQKLKGLVRHTWSRNQTLLGHLLPILDRLERAGIPAAAMQAVPLALRHYPEPGLRAVPHLELLLPPGSLVEGARALGTAGWRPAGAPRGDFAAGAWLVQPRTEPRATCVLRPAVLPGLPPPRPLTSIRHHDAAVCALDPTDELLATCAGLARDQAEASLQWVVDAAMIVRSAGGSIDWARLVTDAARAHVVMRLRDATRRLGDVDVVLPGVFLGSLERVQHSTRDALAHRAAGGGRRSLRRAAAYLVRSGDVSGALRSLLRAAQQRLSD